MDGKVYPCEVYRAQGRLIAEHDKQFYELVRRLPDGTFEVGDEIAPSLMKKQSRDKQKEGLGTYREIPPQGPTGKPDGGLWGKYEMIPRE